jgi:hypothetical protein
MRRMVTASDLPCYANVRKRLRCPRIEGHESVQELSFLNTNQIASTPSYRKWTLCDNINGQLRTL